MRRLLRLDHSEAGLKFTGLVLAGASLTFGLAMSTSPPATPSIQGMEHFAIYARPVRRAQPSRPERSPEIDFTPVGWIGRGGGRVLSGYEVLRATPERATVRLPEGRVTEISRGGRIAGLGGVIAIERRGGDWTIVTEAGVIR
jgi:hypothetical protein